MNQTELYFARQNLLWNLGIYFLIGLGIFLILVLIVDRIYYWWKWRKPKRKEKNNVK